MMANKKPDLVFEVARSEEERADRYLVQRMPEWSRNRIQSLIRQGRIKIGGELIRPSVLLKMGDRVEVWFPPIPKGGTVVADAELEGRILFEDKALLAIDKPAGLVVHPGAGHRGDSVVERLSFKLAGDDWPDPVRPGVVHRLDRDTSGVLLLAKTPLALGKLSAQFANREVTKVYHAIVEGVLRSKSGEVESFLNRHPSSRTRFVVSGTGRWASTQFRVLEFLNDATYLEVRPLTGRSHQIRVHLAHLGHPVVGDIVYGGGRSHKASRQMLHARSLSFHHPNTGRKVTVESELPSDFMKTLDSLRKGA